ncbi:hypothetical protein FKM82_009998 [Ascaphus truei]
MSAPGGMTSVKPATTEIQQICDQIKPQVVQKDGRNFEKFKAEQYATQVVAGINYFIKVDVGCEEFLHLRIFRDLEGELLLSSYQKCTRKDTPLTYC